MFGFQAVNNSGSVTLNSDYPTLAYSGRGSVVVQNPSVVDRPAVGYFSFGAVRTQIAPPRIFVRFNSGRHASCLIYLAMNGSPGAWYGAWIYAGAQGGGTLPYYVIDYVICETASTTVNDNFGMVIYDSTGKPTYKTEDLPVKYNKFTRTWVSQVINQFNFTYYPAGIAIDNDDFIDISSMNRGPVFLNTSNVAYTGMYIFRGGARTCQLSVSLRVTGGNVNPTGINFSIPICKFPSNIYN